VGRIDAYGHRNGLPRSHTELVRMLGNHPLIQETYFGSKNHQILKSLWQDLIAGMKWAELDEKRLHKIKIQKIQFRFML